MDDTSHRHEKDKGEQKAKLSTTKLSPPSAPSIAGPFILTRDESDELLRLMTHPSPPSVDRPPPPPADVPSFLSSKLLQLLIRYTDAEILCSTFYTTDSHTIHKSHHR